MKKFTKICLIASVILIVTGGIICILGAVGGGWRMIDEMDKSSGAWRLVRRMENSDMVDWMKEIHRDATEDVREGLEEIKTEVTDEVRDAWDDAWDDMDDAWESAAEAGRSAAEARKEMEEADREISEMIGQEFHTEVPGEDADTGIGASQVNDMKIDIGGAALCLLESENDNFGLVIDGKGDYKYYESGGVFYLEGKKKHFTGNHDERVYLYIPKGKVFDEVEINMGAGLLSLNELDAREVDLTAGAGILTCNRISCRSLDVEVGAGEAVLKGIEADKMDMEVGMGTAYVKGKIGKEIDASCGMGAVEMDLDNAETDFNYEIECAAGSIILGDKAYSTLADDVHVNNRAAGECSLECSMGSIQMVFAE